MNIFELKGIYSYDHDNLGYKTITSGTKDVLLHEAQNKCAICGFNYVPILEIHHIIPKSSGGNNNLHNLIVLCPNCHRLVHNTMRLNRTNVINVINIIKILHDNPLEEFNLKVFKMILNGSKSKSLNTSR